MRLTVVLDAVVEREAERRFTASSELVIFLPSAPSAQR
jgi:hypothetical protein